MSDEDICIYVFCKNIFVTLFLALICMKYFALLGVKQPIINLTTNLQVWQQIGRHGTSISKELHGSRLAHAFLSVKYNKMPFVFLLLLVCTACVMFDEKSLIIIKHESHIVVFQFWIKQQLALTYTKRITLIQGYYNVCYLKKTLRNKYNKDYSLIETCLHE